MDLALNELKRLICHEIQTSKLLLVVFSDFNLNNIYIHEVKYLEREEKNKSR